MTRFRRTMNSLSVIACLVCPASLLAQPGRPDPRTRPLSRDGVAQAAFKTKTASSVAAAQLIPIDSLAPSVRDKVRRVVTQPTLVTQADADDVKASAKLYDWMLDHPDRVSLAWQRLGVECQTIADRGQGRFGWSDEHGSDLTWFTVANGPAARVWYAEGQIRAGALMPTIPVKAVVVLRHEYTGQEPATTIRHQADVFILSDSRAANLAARLFGPTTDRVAEQGAEQLLMFFGTMARKLTDHPDRVAAILAPGGRPNPVKPARD